MLLNALALALKCFLFNVVMETTSERKLIESTFADVDLVSANVLWFNETYRKAAIFNCDTVTALTVVVEVYLL